MIFRLSKWIALVFLVLLACKKPELIENSSNEFDGEGKTFTFYPFGDTTLRAVILFIPSGAVSRKHYCEHNSIYIDPGFPLDSFEVNFLINDIHQLQSSATVLNMNATITIPFRQSISFDTTLGYKPYKIKLNSSSPSYGQINDPNLWTEISVFSFNNTAKTITFEINDLNACYVIAKRL